MNLQEVLSKTKTYGEKRQFFFKGEMSNILSKLLEGKSYNTSQSLDVLLNQMSDLELFCYIWKDEYSKAYVFDVEDQREELPKAYDFAKRIVQDKIFKKAYIENHDAACKLKFEMMNGNISNFI